MRAAGGADGLGTGRVATLNFLLKVAMPANNACPRPHGPSGHQKHPVPSLVNARRRGYNLDDLEGWTVTANLELVNAVLTAESRLGPVNVEPCGFRTLGNGVTVARLTLDQLV